MIGIDPVKGEDEQDGENERENAHGRYTRHSHKMPLTSWVARSGDRVFLFEGNYSDPKGFDLW